MISQGTDLSNGRNAFRTDATDYLATLGTTDPFYHSPIKVPLVETSIAEDLLCACHRFKRQDILARFDWADLYLKCLAEMDRKQAARKLSPSRIAELFHAIETALMQESPECQARVKTVRQSIGVKTRTMILRLFEAHTELLRPLLIRLRGGKYFKSALQAAGHQDAK
jgi:hypothetical protein